MEEQVTASTEAASLFRFRSINEYLWQELEFAQIFASKPSALNDPFDCQLSIEDSTRRAQTSVGCELRSTILQNIEANAHDIYSRSSGIGVACFSGMMENPLMWSHYTEAHNGVCLRYEFPPNYFANKYPGTNGNFFLIGETSITYGADALYEWLIDGDLEYPISGEPVINAAAKTISVKSDHWSYEDEFRILMSEPGFIAFEPTHLKQITFGLKTSDRHKALIEKMVRRNNPEISFAETERSRDTDFGLSFRVM